MRPARRKPSPIFSAESSSIAPSTSIRWMLITVPPDCWPAPSVLPVERLAVYLARLDDDDPDEPEAGGTLIEEVID